MRRLAPALLAVALFLCLAAPAQAYNLFGYKWPGRTVTYHVGSKYKTQIKMAAKTWNRSGARIRFVRVRSKSRARLKIVDTPGLPVSGYATYSNGRGLIQMHARLNTRVMGTSRKATIAMQAMVVVHEMGHIIGLNHVYRGCSIMNQNFFATCKQPKQAWRYRCRLIERDDIRGAVKLYGGRVKRTGPKHCEIAPQLGPLKNLAVTLTPEGAPRIAWDNPRRASVVRVLRKPGTCPTGPTDKQASLVAEELVGKGARGSTDDYSIQDAGRYCYAVFAIDRWGRPGKGSTVLFDHVGGGPGGPGEEDEPPSASFYSYSPDCGDPLLIQFEDGSFDDYGIARWAWYFGDGSPVVYDEANPSHRYTSAGNYSVTLTVWDERNQTSTYSEQVGVPTPDC